MARQTQVSNVLIRALVEVLQRRGVAPERLLGCASDALLSDPADGRVALSEFQALMARAIALTGEPALGLHCGLLASESSFGLMGHLVSHAASLRQAIDLVSQFHGLLVEDVHIRLSERIGTAQLRCQLHTRIDRSVIELIVAGLVRMLRTFGSGDAEIAAVCFEHTCPAYHRAYTVAFCGAERFAHSFTGVEFAARALDRPHLHWQPELQALMRAEAERGLDRLSRPATCAERIRALIGSRRDGRVPDMACAARELGLSVRSLRRRLEEEGTSYRALTQSMFHASACALLRNRDLTLQAVAHALGFADSSTFHRAFIRCAGVTPAAYRESRDTAPP
jgi:AraC-like DNA-binding protein